MLQRKYSRRLEEFLRNEPDKIMLLNGARQIGKSYLIRQVGRTMFKNFIEINLKEDYEGAQVFATVRTTDDFYIQLGAFAGSRLGTRENTLVFLDEIQSYPHLMTMLKFLNQEARFRYIASGSQLGVALAQTASVPIGSVAIEEMYPLDFEEFLLATGCGQETIDAVRGKFRAHESLNESMHKFMLYRFKQYLLVGGLPEAVNKFLATSNIAQVRKVQRDICNLYRIDASQYGNDRKLHIRRIYDMIPSYMENRKKRVVVKQIEQSKGHKQYSDYADEFEYLTNSGIALAVVAASNPKFPLLESTTKNLLKMYLNDVGLLTSMLYGLNINSILMDEKSVNLGSVYETVVAQELHAHGYPLRYYDNKQKGEVDFLVDDYSNLSVLPIEVKSGKNYKAHSALNKFMNTAEYGIRRSVVFSNARDVVDSGGIVYMPIYYCMFFDYYHVDDSNSLIMPEMAMPQQA
ncbi:MAG: ATP-binding protein [Bacteroidales bacterium]|nr:ATP-binding protein [Bacteroidales bacterium]